MTLSEIISKKNVKVRASPEKSGPDLDRTSPERNLTNTVYN